MENTTNDWLRKKALDVIRRAKEEKYTQIKLAGYGLEQLPDELFDLEELENLDISYNGFTELPPAIARMTHLRFLDLRGNNLQNLPAEISKLSELKHLDLSENPLQCLPEPILQLRELKYLEANTCNIKSLPEGIGSLANLEVLYLSKNQLTDLPESFRELRKMRLCTLEKNPFRADIADKKPKSDYLALFRYDQPVETLADAPKEEVPQSGRVSETPPPTPVESVPDNIMNEARVIVLGLPGAGKTTLCRKILDANAPFEHPGSTNGIDIHQWKFETTPDNVQLMANLWDFGGQEKYEAYHPFFMTDKHTVYVVVANGVEENKANLYKWLEIVSKRAPQSPVMVVISKADERKWENLDEAHLKETFPQLRTSDILRVSSKTGENVEKLRKSIKEAIKNLPGFAQESSFPTGWQNVRKQVEKLSQPDASGITLTHINVSDFEELCKQENITDITHIKELSSYLHNIGAVMYYPDNLHLNHLMVLDMKWAVNGIYKVLDSPIVAQNKGRFNQRNAVDVWKAPNEGESFPIATHGYLIELLKNFEFCYELQQGEFIIPDKLPVSRPATLPEPHGDLLQARLKYENDKGEAVFPKGLLTRLMVKYGKNIDWENVWQKGMRLCYGDAEAIVEQTRDNIIDVKIGGTAANTGKDRFALFQALKSELHLVCQEFNLPQNQLKWSIACQCTVDAKCYFNEKALFARYRGGKSINCNKDEGIEHSVTPILAGAYSQFEDGWKLTVQRLKKDRTKSLFDRLSARNPEYNADKHLEQFNLFTLKKETGDAGRIRQRMITVCTGSNSEEVLRDMVRDLSIDLEMFIRKKWDIKEKITLGKLIGSDTDLRKSYPEFEKDLSDALNYRNDEIHVKDLPKFDFEQLVKIINTYFRVYLLAFQFNPQNVPAPPIVEKYQGRIIAVSKNLSIIACSVLDKKVKYESKLPMKIYVEFTLRKDASGNPMVVPYNDPNKGTTYYNYIADQVVVLTI